MAKEQYPSYEELKKRLDAAENELNALLSGRKDTFEGTQGKLVVRLAEAEKRAAHIKTVLLAIRNVNQLIVSEEDSGQLIQKACLNLTETLGYFNAWIALLDDADRSLKVMASSGFKGGFDDLESILKAGQSTACMSQALDQSAVLVIENPILDCQDCPLSAQYGGRSGLSRRLFYGGKTFGVLSVSVPAEFAFDEEEQSLFAELAEDLAFALHKIEEKQTLRESQRDLKRAQSLAHVGSWRFDLNTGKVTASEETRKIYGLIGADLTIERVQAIALPHYRKALDEELNRLIHEGEPYNIEFKILRLSDQSIRHIHSVAEYDVEQKIVIGILQDITERKQSEERNRLLSDLTMEGILIHKNGMAIDLNTSLAKMIEFSHDDLLNRNFLDFVHADDKKKVLGNMAKDYAPPYLIRLVKSGGAILYVEIESRNFEQNGEKWRVSAVRNVSERIKTEEDLRKRENLLQRVFEIIPIGLWFADHEGKLLRGNPMGVKIWGAEPHVAFSDYGIFKAWRLPSREPIGPEEWALAKTIRNKVTIIDEIMEIEAFDGKRKTILNSTAPVLDENGNVEGAIVVNLDISEQKILEDQLRQAQKMESVGRLAGGVAHDFNNMLGVILGYSELAMEKISSSDSIYNDLLEIRSAAERSADITRQLLAFARKQTIALQVLDLNDTVEGMLNMLRRLIGEDIDLVWSPAQGLWTIQMDPSQIHQILANLCVNARDAISGVGKLTIETGMSSFDAADCAGRAGFLPGHYVVLVVSDNGCGMDPQIVEKLFEPFFTTKDLGKGTGLGLATVYGIVKQNNGFINVYSEPGKGSTFKIYLARYEGADLQAQADNSEDIQQGRGETILIVEDDSAILSLTKTMLERLGYSVLTASTHSEAIVRAQAHSRPLDLLITDVVMPEMNGKDLAEQLKNFSPNMHVLFMSGYTADVIAHHGVLDKSVQFIQKPFSMKGMAKKLRQIFS